MKIEVLKGAGLLNGESPRERGTESPKRDPVIEGAFSVEA